MRKGQSRGLHTRATAAPRACRGPARRGMISTAASSRPEPWLSGGLPGVEQGAPFSACAVCTICSPSSACAVLFAHLSLLVHCCLLTCLCLYHYCLFTFFGLCSTVCSPSSACAVLFAHLSLLVQHCLHRHLQLGCVVQVLHFLPNQRGRHVLQSPTSHKSHSYKPPNHNSGVHSPCASDLVLTPPVEIRGWCERWPLLRPSSTHSVPPPVPSRSRSQSHLHSHAHPHSHSRSRSHPPPSPKTPQNPKP